jgi:hypothetical protein
MKREPPIGEPKAALTPAAAPAQAISRLKVSFLNFFKKFIGRYNTPCPRIAPI